MAKIRKIKKIPFFQIVCKVRKTKKATCRILLMTNKKKLLKERAKKTRNQKKALKQMDRYNMVKFD